MLSGATCLNKEDKSNVKHDVSGLKWKSGNETLLILDAQRWLISSPIRCLALTLEHQCVVSEVPFAVVYKVALTPSSLEKLEHKPSQKHIPAKLRVEFSSRKCRSHSSLRSQRIQNNYRGKHITQTRLLRQLWNETVSSYQFPAWSLPGRLHTPFNIQISSMLLCLQRD